MSIELDDKARKEFLQKVNPNGRLPVLETSEGILSQSHAILRHLARLAPNAKLYGADGFEQSSVDQWVDWSMSQLEPAIEAYQLPYLGYIPYAKSVHDKALTDVKKLIHILDKRIKDNASGAVVGKDVTIADFAIAAALQIVYQFVWDEKFRKGIPNVNNWYAAITENEHWKKVRIRF